jgi:hypothetical protein
LEDIKRNYEETNIRHTKDRILWSYNDSPIGVTRMGNRTHKDSLMKKTFKDFAEACWDTHKQVGFKMKGGKRVPDCVPKNEEEEIEEVSAAMRALRRRNAKSARAKNTIAKYGQAAKMGIPASKVNQRRNTPTRTK